MTTAIETLTAARAAAFAEWQALPDGGSKAAKAVKAAAAEKLAAANRALVAAKRAAAPAEPVADVDAALAARAQRMAAAEQATAVQAAARRLMAAAEYPRCMQGWPATAAERAADALLRQHADSLPAAVQVALEAA